MLYNLAVRTFGRRMGIPPTSTQWPEGYAFLMTELELAGTFLLIAQDARGEEKARRNVVTHGWRTTP